MEPAATPPLYSDRDEERGAGGKLKRPSARKPPATPYSRPRANPHSSRSAGGWWSRLVDPAKRLVSGGATMLLPSFFSQSASAAAAALPPLESQDKLDVEILRNGNEDESHLSHDIPKFTGLTGPSEIVSGKFKRNCSSEGCSEGPNDSKDDTQISRIEQLIQGKNFSRDEVSRLMEILKSRVDEEERNEGTTMSGRAEGVLWTLSSRSPDEGNQRDVDKDILRTPVPLQPNVHDAVGASPVDIAKAYMGSRSLELGPSPSPRNTSLKGKTAAHRTDEVVLNPFIASTSFESSMCWPGAVVQDPRYTTPGQRTRYGLHDFPRTPYSRTVHSKFRDKSQADSRLLRISPNPYQQSRTPIFGQEKLLNLIPDDSYGSVGPIRRIRNKIASEARPRGSSFLSSKHVPSVFKQQGVSDGIIPPSGKEPEKFAGIRFAEPIPLLNPSPSQAVKRILEQLDRKKPTPKEMAEELKLAASWRNSPGETSNPTQKDSFSFPLAGELQASKKTDFVDPMFLSKDRQNEDSSISQIQFPEKDMAPAKDVLASANSHSSSFGPNKNSSSQTSSCREVQATSIGARLAEAGSNLPSQSQSNGQHVTSTAVPNQSKFELAHKVPQHSSGSKPNLAYISVGRRDFSRAASSENGAGFTFPVSTSSNALSEPPTPSVMPFSSNSQSSHSKEELLVPTYSFGSKSAARLVFSFPSTASAPHVDASDLKFDFGTDKKTRLSFGTVGKDAICC